MKEAFSRDAADNPKRRLFLGRPTGSAMPLMWAHAEYIKLLRSANDGVVFDWISAVADRYLSNKGRKDLELWKFQRQIRSIADGTILRIHDSNSFLLRWSQGDWKNQMDTQSIATILGIHYVDIAILKGQRTPIRFTFYWHEAKRWEGKDFQVEIRG